MSAPLALIAVLIERFVGYPETILRAIGHPVIAMGWLIERLDRNLNDAAASFARRRVNGVVALAVLLFVVAVTAVVADAICGGSPWGTTALALLASTLIAQKSLAEHVSAVADALERDGLDAGRAAVSRIVGRDPESLDEAGVCRAAIESLSENFSDGVVAPIFWLGLAGLPGIALYKAINTADSMIGHRTARHEAFGWAAARLDDLVNLPASRLTGLLLALASARQAREVWEIMRRDAPDHRSPNAGWPEAAMAGALGLSLAGPRVYGGVRVDDAEMGAGGRRLATPSDIRAALRLYWIADAVLASILAVATLLAFL